MDTNPLNLLAAMGVRGRKIFDELTEPVSLSAGETLFHQGAAPSSMYMVVAGSLGVYINVPHQPRQLIAVIGAGEPVGEMAVLAGTPRTATVIAIRDCELLKLTKARFDLMQKQHPQLMTGLNRILVHRLRQLSRGSDTKLEPKTAAILPAEVNISTKDVAQHIARELKSDGLQVQLIGPEHAGKPTKWFAEMEAKHDRLLFYSDIDGVDWIRQCARQADRILIVAQAGTQAHTALPADLLRQRADHQLLDLILLYKNDHTRPHGTQEWLKLLPVNRHFHIREDNKKDWHRLARIVSGKAVGVVLSGGGARAYAQIGALQAIIEAGIEIDFVGGSSMGAIIAASLALGSSIEDMSRGIQKAFVNSNPLSDLTIPLVSLVKGRKVERLLKDYFGNLQIPDLWLPFYCVSTNLSDGSLMVHRNGMVRDALRASVAMPGVLPPKIIDDNVLVDGAVLDNLPVDVMRGIHRGPIIAIDVTRDRALLPEMLAITKKTSWLDRLRNPPIISILMSAGTVSSEAEIDRQANSADFLIEPQLGDIDIRDWQAFDLAITIGYEHTVELLANRPNILQRLRHIKTA